MSRKRRRAASPAPVTPMSCHPLAAVTFLTALAVALPSAAADPPGPIARLGPDRPRPGASAGPAGGAVHLQFSPDGSRVRGWSWGWYEWDVKTGAQTRLTPK